MSISRIMAALGVAALLASAAPLAAQAEGMHRNMKRQAMMSHMRMHHPMMMHRSMMHRHHMMMHRRHAM